MSVFVIFGFLLCSCVGLWFGLIGQADAIIDEKTGGVGGYVTATAVTTRTATTHEDLGKNERTQQLETKTVATTTTHNKDRQEQRVVTQEVKTTATVTSGDQVGMEFGPARSNEQRLQFINGHRSLVFVLFCSFSCKTPNAR